MAANMINASMVAAGFCINNHGIFIQESCKYDKRKHIEPVGLHDNNNDSLDNNKKHNRLCH